MREAEPRDEGGKRGEVKQFEPETEALVLIMAAVDPAFGWQQPKVLQM